MSFLVVVRLFSYYTSLYKCIKHTEKSSQLRRRKWPQSWGNRISRSLFIFNVSFQMYRAYRKVFSKAREEVASIAGQSSALYSAVGSAEYELRHCVAVCCSVLQWVAVCCSVLQCVAVCCSVLQCVAVCCSMLQRVTASCSVAVWAPCMALWALLSMSCHAPHWSKESPPPREGSLFGWFPHDKPEARAPPPEKRFSGGVLSTGIFGNKPKRKPPTGVGILSINMLSIKKSFEFCPNSPKFYQKSPVFWGNSLLYSAVGPPEYELWCITSCLSQKALYSTKKALYCVKRTLCKAPWAESTMRCSVRRIVYQKEP